MNLKQIVVLVSGISLFPVLVNHFDIDIKNKEDLVESVDHIKKGTAGLVRFTYGQIKDFLECNK
jgi:hypothetical protein